MIRDFEQVLFSRKELSRMLLLARSRTMFAFQHEGFPGCFSLSSVHIFVLAVNFESNTAHCCVFPPWKEVFGGTKLFEVLSWNSLKAVLSPFLAEFSQC